MEIYVDILFLVNFSIDFIILLAAGKLAGRRVLTLRHILGACVGAVYAVLMFMPEVSLLYTFFAKAAVSLLIVAVSFKLVSVRTFFKTAAAFYLVSFVFGGAVSAGLMATGAGAIVQNGILYFDLPVAVLALSVGIAFTLILVVRGIFRLSAMSNTVDITVIKNGKSVCLTALCDSGNLLTEPVSGAPVVVAECEKLAPLLPDKAIENLALGDVASAVTDPGGPVSFRLIPYRGVGTDGVMAGFVPDGVLIHERHKDTPLYDVVIGIAQNDLSPDKSFHAIIGGMCFDKKAAV